MQSNDSITKTLYSAEESVSMLLDGEFDENREQITDKLLGSYVDESGHDNNSINADEAEKWLNPYSLENFAIVCSYFSCGFGGYFIQTPLAYYMVNDLEATAAQQSVVIGLLSLPWALKIFCGFLTDSYPIYGYRRKPYFIIGWFLFVVCNLVLVMMIKPSIAMLALLLFGMSMSFVQADVCTDAMIVERSKAYEHIKMRGTLQAVGYISRCLGMVVGSLFGAILYNQKSWGWGLPIWAVFVLNALVPLCVISPFVYSLVELKSENPPPFRQQLQTIWRLVQRKAVWKPCSFIFVYNMFLVVNPAWNSFLINGLGFSNFAIGMLVFAGSAMMFIAMLIYKRYLFNTSWRKVYIFATCTSAVFACMQLVLVFGLNKQIGAGAIGYAMVFAMFSYGGVQFVNALQFLPACRMYLGMCPDGAEGASYAMLTTISNVAGTVAYSFAGAMASVWDVSNDTLEAHDYSGMWKLTLFCGCIQLVGLLFLNQLPNGVDEQASLTASSNTSSKFMGSIFVSILAASIVFVVVFTVITVIGG